MSAIGRWMVPSSWVVSHRREACNSRGFASFFNDFSFHFWLPATFSKWHLSENADSFDNTLCAYLVKADAHIAPTQISLISALISETRHAVVRNPSFIGFGNLPDAQPAHQADLPTGIIGGIGGLALGSPMICFKRRKPVSGSWSIWNCLVSSGYVAILVCPEIFLNHLCRQRLAYAGSG